MPAQYRSRRGNLNSSQTRPVQGSQGSQDDLKRKMSNQPNTGSYLPIQQSISDPAPEFNAPNVLDTRTGPGHMRPTVAPDSQGHLPHKVPMPGMNPAYWTRRGGSPSPSVGTNYGQRLSPHVFDPVAQNRSPAPPAPMPGPPQGSPQVASGGGLREGPQPQAVRGGGLRHMGPNSGGGFFNPFMMNDPMMFFRMMSQMYGQ